MDSAKALSGCRRLEILVWRATGMRIPLEWGDETAIKAGKRLHRPLQAEQTLRASMFQFQSAVQTNRRRAFRQWGVSNKGFVRINFYQPQIRSKSMSRFKQNKQKSNPVKSFSKRGCLCVCMCMHNDVSFDPNTLLTLHRTTMSSSSPRATGVWTREWTFLHTLVVMSISFYLCDREPGGIKSFWLDVWWQTGARLLIFNLSHLSS